MNGNPAPVACMAALGASHSPPYFLNVLPQKLLLLRGGIHLLPAAGAHLAHQTLGHQPYQGIGHQIVFHPHILQTDNAGGRVVGMQGAEHHMAGNSRPDRDLRRLPVSGLSHHNNVRVLTQKGPKPCLKCQSCHRVDLGLVNAWHIFLHRVLDCRNVHPPFGQIL